MSASEQTRELSARWPKTLAEIFDVLRALFVRRGRAHEAASEEARAVAAELGQHFGGRQIYLPRGEALTLALRDAEIYAAANGRNTRELSERYGVSDRTIQKIVAAQATRNRTQRSNPQ